MSDRSIDLSPAGRARRGVMLDELLGTMRRVHRGRRLRHRAAAAALLLALGGVVAWLVPAVPVDVPVDVAAPIVRAPAVDAPPRRVNVALVETDPAILARYAAAPTRRTAIIDDQSLLGALAAIDRPTGLVRRGGRMWLTDDVLTTP